MFHYILGILFQTYSLMLLTRVLGSFFPSLARSRFMQFIAYYTDPYLKIFRSIIPPLGFLDISPMFAFATLQVAQWMLYALL